MILNTWYDRVQDVASAGAYLNVSSSSFLGQESESEARISTVARRVQRPDRLHVTDSETWSHHLLSLGDSLLPAVWSAMDLIPCGRGTMARCVPIGRRETVWWPFITRGRHCLCHCGTKCSKFIFHAWSHTGKFLDFILWYSDSKCASKFFVIHDTKPL